MRHGLRVLVFAGCALVWGPLLLAADLPAIDRVKIQQRAFHVNGRPFLPIMIWLQDAGNFPRAQRCGINTVAGYWPGSSGTRGVVEYQALVHKAGLYGVMPYDPQLKGQPGLLGYIHEDEPDLPHEVNDAQVEPGPGLHLNAQTPLGKIVDGVTHSWSVLDPLADASLTIRLPEPATIERIALWPTISEGLAVVKEVDLEADGKKILSATLEARKGQQVFPLSSPVTVRQLTLHVRSTYPGANAWGSLGEVEAFDAAGRNVLLAPPRQEPRMAPQESLAYYRKVHAADPSRPVFLTVTGYFHPHFAKWTDAQRTELYPAYVKACDVIGYDIYPIYGWNRPDWIHLVHEGTRDLVALAGPRPVYAWIETSKGGEPTGPLDKQHAVTPAHIRAEVWMAICRGATAIGYFTHVWKPAYSQFGVPEENQVALARVNAELAQLAPAILSEPPQGTVEIAASDDTKLDLMAREHDGKLYLFAVNYDERGRAVEATIRADRLASATAVTVLGEDRSVTAEAGRFRDRFEPLAVHLYAIPLDKAK